MLYFKACVQSHQTSAAACVSHADPNPDIIYQFRVEALHMHFVSSNCKQYPSTLTFNSADLKGDLHNVSLAKRELIELIQWLARKQLPAAGAQVLRLRARVCRPVQRGEGRSEEEFHRSNRRCGSVVSATNTG